MIEVLRGHNNRAANYMREQIIEEMEAFVAALAKEDKEASCDFRIGQYVI